MMEELMRTGSQEKRTLEVIEREIHEIDRQAMTLVRGVALARDVEIGRRLEEAKAVAGHGGWLPWLEKMEIKPTTAQSLMNIFRAYGADQQSMFGGVLNSQTFGNLSRSQAIALLEIEDVSEREKFVEEHDAENMSVRELKKALRERDEARQEAEGAAMAISEAEALRDQAREAREAAEKRVQALMKEMEELKARPVEVAVEVDEEAVERARAEARAEMEQRLEAANQAREAAEAEQRKACRELETLMEKARAEARAEMEGKLEKAEEKRKRAEKRVRALEEHAGAAAEAERERACILEKKLAAAAPGVAAFKVLFSAWQEDFHKLMEALGDVGDETRPKLTAAVGKVLEEMGGRIA